MRFNNNSEDFITMNSCPHCGGALFVNDDIFNYIKGLYKCFQCSRLYVAVNNSFVLWAEYERQRNKSQTQNFNS